MSDRSIGETVRYLAGTHQTDQISLVDAAVNTVDEDARTCQCTAITGPKGSELTARLMSDVDDGILAIPTEGSTVTIAYSIFCEPTVVGYGGVDKIIFRGGDLGGLVKVEALTQKLNNLENKMNDLLEKFNAHTHNVTAVGSPTGPNLLPESGTLTPTVRGDIENETITHG